MGNSLYSVYVRDRNNVFGARKNLIMYLILSLLFTMMAALGTYWFVSYPQHRGDPHTWVMMAAWVAPFFCWKAYKNDAGWYTATL